MKNENGMTLVEVVSVLVILSVLAGFAFPEFNNWKSELALRAEVSNLVCALHKARVAAIRSNACVVFSYTETGYKIYVDNGFGGGTEKDWRHQPGEQLLADVTLEGGVRVVLSDSSFTLQRTRFTGTPGIKAGSVVLRAGTGSKTKIVVNAIGRVRVEKV